MIKRIVLASTAAALALGGFAVHSHGQSAPTPTTCYAPNYSTSYETSSIKYDTRTGVTLSIYTGSGRRTATIALESGGEPNPHFDRLYALAMKGFDSRRIEEVCVEGPVGGTEPAPVVSISLRHTEDTAPQVQKVAVCDASGYSCASVSTYSGVSTYQTNR
jgi:hypothetical protein